VPYLSNIFLKIHTIVRKSNFNLFQYSIKQYENNVTFSNR